MHIRHSLYRFLQLPAQDGDGFARFVITLGLCHLLCLLCRCAVVRWSARVVCGCQRCVYMSLVCLCVDSNSLSSVCHCNATHVHTRHTHISTSRRQLSIHTRITHAHAYI